MACALIGTNCNNLASLRRGNWAVATATRSAVAPRYTPGIGKIVPRNYTPGIGKIVPRNYTPGIEKIVPRK